MKRKPLLWTLAGFFLLAIVFFAWPKGPAEPVYQGKKLSQWVAEASTSIRHPTEEDEIEIARNARTAIRAIGTNALPWLMHEFTRPHSKWKAKVDSWVAKNTK